MAEKSTYWLTFLPDYCDNVKKMRINETVFTALRKRISTAKADNAMAYDSMDLAIDLRKMVFYRVTEEVGNPFNHTSHYDDPLN